MGRLHRTADKHLTAPLGEVRRRAARTVSGVTRRGRSRPADLSGWTVAEYLAYRSYLDSDGRLERPVRRAGSSAVRTINQMSAVLPPEAIVVARAITDAAPPAQRPVNPTLSAVLERYLPESLAAFGTQGPANLRRNAEQLLLGQLDLLHEVTVNVQRAQAEHNERDLQIQETFLRDRFAELRPGNLDLHPQGATESAPEAARARPKPTLRRGLPPQPARRSVHIVADSHPVALFEPGRSPDRRLSLRLALPRGHRATLGCVFEGEGGTTGFVHTSSRRLFTGKRDTGFRAAQTDVSLRVDTSGMRRFLIYVRSVAKSAPTNSVLFIRDSDRNHAELATVLTNRAEAAITVVCSGLVTDEGVMLRNESLVYPHLRAVCEGFGFVNVSWLDDHSPIV